LSDVIVTGCFGFIGSSLVNELKHSKNNVYGIGSNSQNKAVDDGFVNGELSFENLDLLLARMSKVPDTIYHLAGGSSVGAANDKPYLDFLKSVNTSAILFEWVRLKCPHTNIVLSSSAAVYGSNSVRKLSENSEVNPFSNYGYHKDLVERLADMYRSNYDIHITIARLFSVYGNGLRKQLLWDTCSKLRLMKPPCSLESFGTGLEERDWVHIDDVCTALIALGSLEKRSPDIVNIGTGITNTVSEMLNLLIESWFGTESGIDVIFNGESRAGDPFSLISKNSVNYIISGKPRIKLENGIVSYVKWFKALYDS
jgi:UDP-glucose 4-epimerase